MKILLSYIFVSIAFIVCNAQESTTLPVVSDKNSQLGSNPIIHQKLNLNDSIAPNIGRLELSNPIIFNNSTSFERNPYSGNFSQSGIINVWGNGYVVGASSYDTFPAMGNIRNTWLGISNNFGDFNFTIGLSGAKYHLDRNIYNSFGVSGNLSYRVNNRLTLNVFGGVYNSPVFHSFAAMPYLQSSYYGASAKMMISNSFGMTLGAQRHFDPYSRRWITDPIVAPSLKIGGVELGIDLGGLIGNILRGNDDSYKAPKINKPITPSGPILQRWQDKYK